FAEPETGHLDLHPEDILLLATDGLYKQISSRKIHSLLNTEEPLKDKARALVRAAIDAGGKDNITVLLVRGHP
ncbi:MAG: SpoIIE family protein phosphatase, partial [Desulfobacterales bacterium]|nr:SpoIIE family protein phosphatase [Desulfobacterales bacterium]